MHNIHNINTFYSVSSMFKFNVMLFQWHEIFVLAEDGTSERDYAASITKFRAIINILIVLQFVQNLSFDIRTFWRPCERFVWYVSNIGLMNIICHFVNYHLSIVSLIILFISLSSSIGLTFVWYLFHIVRYKLLSHIYFLPI